MPFASGRYEMAAPPTPETHSSCPKLRTICCQQGEMILYLHRKKSLKLAASALLFLIEWDKRQQNLMTRKLLEREPSEVMRCELAQMCPLLVPLSSAIPICTWTEQAVQISVGCQGVPSTYLVNFESWGSGEIRPASPFLPSTSLSCTSTSVRPSLACARACARVFFWEARMKGRDVVLSIIITTIIK